MTEQSSNRGYVKGSLVQVPFSKVLKFVQVGQKTGVLAIAREKSKVHIHLQNGQIVYVTSSYFSGLSLGDFLLKEGKISMQIHEESLSKIRETNQKQGTYLVEKSYISPHELMETLSRQVLEKLFWLFEWQDGDFYFKEGEIIQKDLHLVQIEMPKLIYQGIRDHMIMNKMPTEFKGRKESVLMLRESVPFSLETLGLGPIDTRILSMVNGRYTLRQVVALARLKKRAIYKILYGLYLCDVICFPEGLKTQKADESDVPAVQKKPGQEGYEVHISNDLIAQAVESVERIHEKVSSEQDDVLEVTLPPVSAPADQLPAVSETLDELGMKLDEVLTGDEAAEVEKEFGFDEDSSDGFAGAFDSKGNHDRTDTIYPDLGDDDAFNLDEPSKDLGFEHEDIEPEEPEDQESDFQMDPDDFTNPTELKKQGIMLLEEQHFNQAKRFLSRAVEMAPQDTDLAAYLGWAIFHASDTAGDRFIAAEEAIKEGMGPGKSSHLHFLYLGKIYVEEDQLEFAELHFVKALEISVDCIEAREQIKKIHGTK